MSANERERELRERGIKLLREARDLGIDWANPCDKARREERERIIREAEKEAERWWTECTTTSAGGDALIAFVEHIRTMQEEASDE